MTEFATRIQRERLGLDKPIDATPTVKRMSMDELLDMANVIAQDPEAGPDRFRAIKMLTQVQTASVMLAEPMNDGEVVDRIARVMKGGGYSLTLTAFAKAFPNRTNMLAKNIGTAYADATPEQVAESRKTTSLKLLYKHYPETKRHGVPKGFPSGHSIAAKTAWCQNQALKILIEREISERRGVHEATTAIDKEIRGAMDGSPPAGD